MSTATVWRRWEYGDDGDELVFHLHMPGLRKVSCELNREIPSCDSWTVTILLRCHSIMP